MPFMNDSISKRTPAIKTANEAGGQDAKASAVARRPMQFPKWTWQGFLAVTSALMGVSAVLLHLIGSAIHQTYLSQWGIDPGQFPKSTDWLVIQGYYGIWNGLGLAFLALLKKAHWVVLAAIAFALYLAFLSMPWSPFEGRSEAADWASKFPDWARTLLLFSAVGVLIAVALLPFTLFAFLLTGIPAIVGKEIGKEVAVQQSLDFIKGCDASTEPCILLLKKGEANIKGHLIDSSPSHIALLDTQLKFVRVIAREGFELQSTRLPVPK
jgi:hypothetical protein